MKASSSIFHDTRRIKKNGKYPVKIQIYFNRERKYYTTRFEYTKEEFQFIFTQKPKEPYKTNKLEIESLVKKADEIIEQLGSYFTFELFNKKYLLNRRDRGNVFAVYKGLIKELEGNDQIGTATTYNNSLRSLETYVGKEVLRFEQVTVDFLKRYEKWMSSEGSMRIGKKGEEKIKKGNSKNTIGMYLRALRAVYKIGIRDGDVPEIAYPFGKNGYIIPAGRNFKRALDIHDVLKILTYQSEASHNDTLLFARDIWLFTYLGNGLNLKDIANLRFKNILGETIVFNRAKTANTKKDKQVQIKIDYDDELKKIIFRWGNKEQTPDNYIFPILKKGMDAKKQHSTIKQTIKTVNKYIKRIGLEVGIELSLTTYVARHSFATILRDAGATPAMLSEQMGNSEHTVKNYLGDFADAGRKELRKALTTIKSEEGNNV
jgi:integrase/recombinase XerD